MIPLWQQSKPFRAGTGLACVLAVLLLGRGCVSVLDAAIRDYDAEKISSWGYSLIEAGRPKEAIRVLRGGVKANPDNSNVHNNLGYALMLVGRLEESEKECRLAVRLGPNETWCHDSLAQVLTRLGKLDEALAECHRALELNPESKNDKAAAHNSLGHVLYLQGKKAEARREWETAEGPGSPEESNRAENYLRTMP